MRRIRCNHCGRILRKLFIENCDDVGDSRFEDTGYSVDDEGFIEVCVDNKWAGCCRSSSMKDSCETVVCPYCLEPIGDYMEIDYCCQPLVIGSGEGYEIVHEGFVRDIENVSQGLDHTQSLQDKAQEVADRVGSDGKLVCPNCGKKMPRILVHTFMQDGSDKDIPTDYIYDNGLIRFETDENWTGYCLQDDATDVPSKEMLETISCPFCLKNFKSDYISISEPLDVVLSIKGSEERSADAILFLPKK